MTLAKEGLLVTMLRLVMSTGVLGASGCVLGVVKAAVRAFKGQVKVGEKRSSLRTDQCITQVYIHVGCCPKVVHA